MKNYLLLTNDDGIEAEGLAVLWKHLYEHHNVSIVAPSKERSGSGASITFTHVVEARKETRFGKTDAWQVDGTPADCVKLALNHLIEHPIDWVISGINRGSNAGRNILYSGTVGAAIEAARNDLPAIAVSCLGYETCQFELAGRLLPLLLTWLKDHPLPKGSLLNVNVPYETPIKGVRLARQGLSYWGDNVPLQRLHEGEHRFIFQGQHLKFHELPGSDIDYLAQGYIAIVPIFTDDLTHYHWLHEKRDEVNSMNSTLNSFL